MSTKAYAMQELTLEQLCPNARFAVVRYERVPDGIRRTVCGKLHPTEDVARDVERRMNRLYLRTGKRGVWYRVVRVKRSNEVEEEL